VRVLLGAAIAEPQLFAAVGPPRYRSRASLLARFFRSHACWRHDERRDAGAQPGDQRNEPHAPPHTLDQIHERPDQHRPTPPSVAHPPPPKPSGRRAHTKTVCSAVSTLLGQMGARWGPAELRGARWRYRRLAAGDTQRPWRAHPASARLLDAVRILASLHPDKRRQEGPMIINPVLLVGCSRPSSAS
jgi:hypothetical protein